MSPDLSQHHNNKAMFWRHLLSLGVIGFVAMGVSLYSPDDSIASKTSPERLSLMQVPEVVEEIPVVEPNNVVVAVSPPKLPEVTGDVFPAEAFSASHVAIKDHQTGAMIFEQKGYEAHPIASITKLMTALVLQDLDLVPVATATIVSDNVFDSHVTPGDVYTVDELYQASLVGSSNRAMLTLVDASGLSREAFVSRMNEKAIELGLLDTVFVEPTGLDERNVASPSDVLLLLDTALDNSYIARLVQQPEVLLYSDIREKEHKMYSTNWLLLNWIPHDFTDYRGGKTGYIPASGYNVANRVGNDDGRILDIVVLGTTSNEARFTESRNAAEWAFANVSW